MVQPEYLISSLHNHSSNLWLVESDGCRKLQQKKENELGWVGDKEQKQKQIPPKIKINLSEN